MADKIVATVHLTNGVLAKPHDGGPLEVAFLHFSGDRLLSDVLTDAFAQCDGTDTYAHIEMTIRFKTGKLVVDGPADSAFVQAALEDAGMVPRKGWEIVM